MAITRTGFSFKFWGDCQFHRSEVGIGAFYWKGGGFSFTLGFRTVSFGVGDNDYDHYRGIGFSRVFSEEGNNWQGYWNG